MKLEHALKKKETEQREREKQGHPIMLCSSLISRIRIGFRPRLPVKAGDLALPLTVTRFSAQTGAGSKTWPWLCHLTYVLDGQLSEQHPSEHPALIYHKPRSRASVAIIKR